MGPDPVAAGSDDHNRLYSLVQIVLVVQLALLAGLIWVLMQLGDLPQRTADLVPQGGDAGEIFQLQDSVDQLSTKLDAIEVKLAIPTEAP